MTHTPRIPATLDLSVQTFSALSAQQAIELKSLWRHAVAIDAHAIGWLPIAAFETRTALDDVIAIHRNNDLVGWVLIGKSRHRAVMKLYQVWVRSDARILEHGTALVAAVRNRAEKERCFLIEAWVAEDLPANLFWHALGFNRGNWRWGRGEKPRKLYRWTIHTHPLLGELHVNNNDRSTHHEGTPHRMAETR
jgi:GNAT superfamily N-acetyltransferase